MENKCYIPDFVHALLDVEHIGFNLVLSLAKPLTFMTVAYIFYYINKQI